MMQPHAPTSRNPMAGGALPTGKFVRSGSSHPNGMTSETVADAGDDGRCILHANGDLLADMSGGEFGRAAQRRRRARILSTARHLIARHGRDGFVLKEVAELCDVSVQTIYNLVGDRSRVMAVAVNEFIAASFTLAGDPAHPARFLVLADNYWTTAAEQPDYVRNATIDYFSPHQDYRQAVQSFAARIYADSLGAMKRGGYLSAGADTQALAYRFTCLTAAMVFDWSIGSRSLEELRVDLFEGHAALLRGVLMPHAVEEIDRWLGAHGHRVASRTMAA